MPAAFHFVAILLLALPSSGLAQQCKAVPGTSEWPSQAVWQQFNETVEGRLIDPSPPAAVCHAERAEFDSKACKTVTDAWSLFEYHSEHPISNYYNQWNNDTCLPQPDAPCTGDGYPQYVVNATNSHHVKLAVDFARENNVRLIVKNTGHDYLGRSVAPNALSIWTHHLDSIAYDEGSFTPQGCPKCGSHEIGKGHVTLGPGNQFLPAYTYLDQFNVTIVGGAGFTVGVGGYITGGGHGVLSPKYGLAVDQVLEMEMVTPQGDIVILNECQNTDLFWAVRGGGGSTFGVLTSVTLKTYPSPKIAAATFGLTAPPNTPAAAGIPSLVMSRMPDIDEQGGSGYMWTISNGPNPFDMNVTTNIGGVYGVLAVAESEDVNDLDKIWKPIVAEAKKRWGSDVRFSQQPPAVVPSLLEFIKMYHDTGMAGIDTWCDSWLLSAEALSSEPDELAETNKCATSRFDGATLGILITAGKGVREAKPRGRGTAVQPGWRKSTVMLGLTNQFEPLDSAARQSAIDKTNECMAPVRKLDPSSGAYLNEALPDQPDWQRAFWGENHDRLVQLKKQVDPDDVFWCKPCVGSDGWTEVDGQLCRV